LQERLIIVGHPANLLFLGREVKEQYLYADFARGAFLYPKQAILAR
jgi:hypothetical protein